jgi:hypothetical protein
MQVCISVIGVLEQRNKWSHVKNGWTLDLWHEILMWLPIHNFDMKFMDLEWKPTTSKQPN